MKIPIFQIDAFTGELFAGNPAAVCPLQQWLDDGLMQSIAAENNLAETAFIVQSGVGYDIRWFTPETEVDLCGHATLASAYVVFNRLEPSRKAVTFASKSGLLSVTRDDDLLSLDFPSRPAKAVDPPKDMERMLGATPREVLKAAEYLAVFESSGDVRSMRPDFPAIKELASREGMHGIIVTAPDDEVDFVSRFFAPAAGIPEDPVTGAAHCTLVPYWSRRLKKTSLHALQVSPRGGELFCEDAGDRVVLAGRAVPYLEGTIEV